MKGTLIVVLVFAIGCLAGYSGLINLESFGEIGSNLTMYVLYLLIFLVGISMGCNPELKKIIKSVSPKIFLLPLVTILGTLCFSALVSLLISGWGVFDCLAVGSGMGYYSLSSVLISQYKEASLGVQLAAELGTIALLTNIFREMFTLLGAPLFVRYFGRLAPICAGGATTMDTTLPVITRYAGNDLVFVSILHGILVDFSVPFLVSFFCQL